jgi:D-3-phosphoglycerate dehydrogenase / 2-oxoglutarate reductase
LFELDTVIGTPHLGASTQEAQTNVAVAVAEQIIAYLKHKTVINAVNVPSVTGELLKKLSPYLTLADRMGCLHAQLIRGPVKEVIIEYTGDFQGLDLSPVTTALLNGLLAMMVKDEVNAVNAPIIAKDMGIKVTEITSGESLDFTQLISVKIVTTGMENIVEGTIFGKNDPRIVQINNFRLEIIPKGHLALIHNMDKPGAIGSIGTVLGANNLNIARMQVGQEKDGERNVIILRTDTPIPDQVVKQLLDLPMVKSVVPLTL